MWIFYWITQLLLYSFARTFPIDSHFISVKLHEQNPRTTKEKQKEEKVYYVLYISLYTDMVYTVY